MRGLSRSPVVPPSLSAHKCGTTRSTIRHLAGSTRLCLSASPLHPRCLSLPLLLVWMNFSSLTPWLLDNLIFWKFWLFFFNFLFSFFWLFEEAKYIYLHLHLGQSQIGVFRVGVLNIQSKPLASEGYAGIGCSLLNAWCFVVSEVYGKSTSQLFLPV